MYRQEIDKCVYNELCAIRPELSSYTLKQIKENISLKKPGHC